MKKSYLNKRLSISVFLHTVSLSFAVFAAYLLVYHSQAISSAKQVSMPLVAQIPILERRLAAVTQQIEMAELHAAGRFGSQEEKVDVLIFPSDPDFDRLISFFDVVREYFGHNGELKNLSKISVGDPIKDIGDFNAYPISLKFDSSDEGMKEFFSLIRLSGLLTVGDALSLDERSLLLYRTEEENPAGIVALEQFFATDLLRYVSDSDSYQQQLLRSFSSASFLSAFQGVLQSSILHEANMVLGGRLGSVIAEQNLWPFPLLSLEKATIQKGNAPGWQSVDVTLLLYTKN